MHFDKWKFILLSAGSASSNKKIARHIVADVGHLNCLVITSPCWAHVVASVLYRVFRPPPLMCMVLKPLFRPVFLTWYLSFLTLKQAKMRTIEINHMNTRSAKYSLDMMPYERRIYSGDGP